MKTFYIQLGPDNKVTDIIEYQVEGYTEASLSTPLPDGAYSGIYQYVGGALVYRSDWDSKVGVDKELETLRNQVDQLTLLVAMQGGAIIG